MAPGNLAIAEYYRDFLDGLIIDRIDEHEAAAVEKLGIQVKIADTVMRSLQDRVNLAETTLQFAFGLIRR